MLFSPLQQAAPTHGDASVVESRRLRQRRLRISDDQREHLRQLRQDDWSWDADGNDSRATSVAANKTYSYAVSTIGPTVVTTNTLNDESGYNTSTALYDGLLRPVQTQDPTPQGGRPVTNTFYDTHGWVIKKNNAWGLGDHTERHTGHR